MKKHLNQNGHVHLALFAVVALLLIGFAGFNVYNAHSPQKLNSTLASAANPPATCDDLDNMSDEEYAQYTEDQLTQLYNQLCGPDDTAPVDDGPITDVPATDDPSLVEPDPCPATAGLSDEQYDQLTDAELDALCGPDNGPVTGDEGSDGGQTPSDATNIAGAVVAVSGKQACVNSLVTKSPGKIKSYGKSRISYRKHSLKSISKQVSKHYSKKASAGLRTRIKVANSKIKAVAKKHHKRVSSVGGIKISTPKSHVKQLRAELKATSKALSSANSRLNKAKTRQQLATASCSAIFDAQVHAYLVPKIKSQELIDSLYVQNAAYSINYQTVQKISKLRGKSMPKLTNPTAITAQINSLQSTLDTVTAQSANDYINSGGKVSNLLNSRLSDGYKSVKSTLKHDDSLARKRIKTTH